MAIPGIFMQDWCVMTWRFMSVGLLRDRSKVHTELFYAE